MILIRNSIGGSSHARLVLALVPALVMHALILGQWKDVREISLLPSALATPATRIAIHYRRPEPVVPRVAAPEKIVPKPAAQQKPVPRKTTKQVTPRRRPAVTPPVQAVKPEPAGKVAALQPAAPAPAVTQPPLTRNPVFKGERTPPVYPKRALRLRQEGDVVLHVLLDETGGQQKLRVAKASGYPLLDDAAVKAVRQWRFQPVQRAGKVIASWVEVPVSFRIH